MKMRTLICCLTLAVFAAARADAGIISIGDLYNTGVDAGHNLLTIGASDPHYSLVGPGGSSTPIAKTHGSPWVSNLSDAQWIQPAANAQVNGTYTYTTSFTLANDAILSSALISGKFTADDKISNVILNGTALGIGTTGEEVHGSWFNFSILGSSPFQHGVNTLSFETRNTRGVASGLIVQMTGSYDATPVPEPASAVMMGLGVGAGLVVVALRRRSKAVAG